MNSKNQLFENYKADDYTTEIGFWFFIPISNFHTHTDFNRYQHYNLSNGIDSDLPFGIRPLLFHHQDECA